MPPKLGQHFLVNEKILERLAVATCGEAAERVVEIGPGRGALTRHLLRRTNELHAIELDESFAEPLQSQFHSVRGFHFHQGDVLKTDLAQWGPAVVTGNLPYYVTSPIVEKFLELDYRFPTAVFLVQSEVAHRIAASPGSRDYGYLSVHCQLICQVEIVCKVPPGAFSPPPKVDSAAVRFLRRAEIGPEWRSVLKLASHAFAHKRKTLRNNLKPAYGSLIDNFPEAALRAEQLSVEHFIDLHRRLVSYTETS